MENLLLATLLLCTSGEATCVTVDHAPAKLIFVCGVIGAEDRELKVLYNEDLYYVRISPKCTHA